MGCLAGASWPAQLKPVPARPLLARASPLLGQQQVRVMRLANWGESLLKNSTKIGTTSARLRADHRSPLVDVNERQPGRATVPRWPRSANALGADL